MGWGWAGATTAVSPGHGTATTNARGSPIRPVGSRQGSGDGAGFGPVSGAPPPQPAESQVNRAAPSTPARRIVRGVMPRFLVGRQGSATTKGLPPIPDLSFAAAACASCLVANVPARTL